MPDYAGVDPDRLARMLDVPPSLLGCINEVYPNGFGTDPAEVLSVLTRSMLSGPVVDIGCGFGQVAVAVASEFRVNVLGVDAHQSLIHAANQRATRLGVQDLCRFEHADLESWVPQHQSKWQLVLALSIWGIFGDEPQTAQALARLVRPNGYLITNLTLSSSSNAIEDPLRAAIEYFERERFVVERELRRHWPMGRLRLAAKSQGASEPWWQTNRDRMAKHLEYAFNTSAILVCRLPLH